MKSRAMTHKVFLQVFLLSTLWLTALTTSAASASGTTYYVAPNGNDSNPGTEANPWLTIQRAADTLQAGDTVYIKAGTYNEQVIVKNSGNANNWITFTSYPGGTVIIDGSGLDLGGWGALFQINDKSYVKVSGLQIENSFGGVPGPAGILVIDSYNIIIENNSTYNTSSSGIGVWRSSNVVVDGNDIQQAVNGGSQECLTISGANNFEVKNNTVHNGVGLYRGGEGIDIKQASSYGKVYDNHVYDLPGEVGLYIDAYSSKYPNHLHDIEVYNNVVTTPEGIALGAEQGGHIENIKVYNNIVYGSSSYGIVVTSWIGENEGTKRNVEIVNNTVYGCGWGDWGGGIRVETEKVENIIINNNIISQNDGWQLSVKSGARNHVSANNNLIDGFLNGYEEVHGNNHLEGNPRFVNSARGDFHLMSDSPAIDAGTLANAPVTDLGGNHRPQGIGHDIGAYEYGGTAPPPPILLPFVSKSSL